MRRQKDIHADKKKEDDVPWNEEGSMSSGPTVLSKRQFFESCRSDFRQTRRQKLKRFYGKEACKTCTHAPQEQKRSIKLRFYFPIFFFQN